jgi:hypothetical protein
MSFEDCKKESVDIFSTESNFKERYINLTIQKTRDERLSSNSVG